MGTRRRHARVVGGQGRGARARGPPEHPATFPYMARGAAPRLATRLAMCHPPRGGLPLGGPGGGPAAGGRLGTARRTPARRPPCPPLPSLDPGSRRAYLHSLARALGFFPPPLGSRLWRGFLVTRRGPKRLSSSFPQGLAQKLWLCYTLASSHMVSLRGRHFSGRQVKPGTEQWHWPAAVPTPSSFLFSRVWEAARGCV